MQNTAQDRLDEKILAMEKKLTQFQFLRSVLDDAELVTDMQEVFSAARKPNTGRNRVKTHRKIPNEKMYYFVLAARDSTIYYHGPCLLSAANALEPGAVCGKGETASIAWKAALAQIPQELESERNML